MKEGDVLTWLIRWERTPDLCPKQRGFLSLRQATVPPPARTPAYQTE